MPLRAPRWQPRALPVARACKRAASKRYGLQAPGPAARAGSDTGGQRTEDRRELRALGLNPGRHAQPPCRCAGGSGEAADGCPARVWKPAAATTAGAPSNGLNRVTGPCLVPPFKIDTVPAGRVCVAPGCCQAVEVPCSALGIAAVMPRQEEGAVHRRGACDARSSRATGPLIDVFRDGELNWKTY